LFLLLRFEIINPAFFGRYGRLALVFILHGKKKARTRFFKLWLLTAMIFIANYNGEI
jgi:hypothetical protein